ncbi:predicted protein [Histoplasma capsulatum H143]|uniref:Uncharacterized protein n=1 Tax=Ajellomyces capsulatus (strain H143) TaxID=544712 RepID=C6H7Y1_AJECH|nr:predicted protein [Histoplasma capsulatum H143]
MNNVILLHKAPSRAVEWPPGQPVPNKKLDLEDDKSLFTSAPTPGIESALDAATVSWHQATERSIRHKGDTILLRPFRHPADGKWAKSDHIPPERIDSNYLPACPEGEVYLGKFWMGEDSTRGAVQDFGMAVH